MNKSISGLNNLLDTNFENSDLITTNSTNMTGIISDESDIIPYTDNPELKKEVDNYKDARNISIITLSSARDCVATLISESFQMSRMSALDPKELDAFAKIANTLVNVVKSIDELTNPQKVELYIDPKREEKKEETNTVNNVTNNNIILTPAEMLKIIRGDVT